MSKASRQTLALLSVVNGCYVTIRDNQMTNEYEVLVSKMIKATENAILEFPTTGNEQKNLDWIVNKIHEWKKLLDSYDSNWKILILIQMSHQILEDLSNKIKDTGKRKLLIPCINYTQELSDIFDNHDDFDVYEIANNLLIDLYNKLEFSL